MLTSVILMILISTSQASQELNCALSWPSGQLLQSQTHVLSMMQITLCVYNAKSQLVCSIKSTFVKNLNATNVIQVSMVNPYWINSMETQGFPSA